MKKTDLLPDVLTRKPTISPTAFIATGARIIGDVTLGEESSVWYNAVLRGDINRIVIGRRTNIQDGCILHLENEHPCIVGDDVTVGHGAILHGCIIEDGVLIGMGATVLSGAVIQKGSIVGAGAVVTEGLFVPPFSLVVGVPAKIVKSVPESTYDTNLAWAQKYVLLSAEHRRYFSS